LENGHGITRDHLIEKLADFGIDTRPFFYPIHIMPPYKENAIYPIAEKLSREGFNLPSGANLSNDELEKVASALHSIIDLEG
jgi:perosamine synthetase